MVARLLTLAASLSILLGIAVTSTVRAEPAGLAWDSVTKFDQTTDVTSMQPGSFDSDFTTASSAQGPAESGGGGFLGRARAAMRMGGGMAAAMQSGFAERHYVAGPKERTDSLFAQTARIVDCSARTITTLDLKAKTYRIESMDRPQAATETGHGGPPAHAEAPPADDGSKVALDLTNTALGAREIAGQSTQGYRSLLKITTTKANGDTDTANVDMVDYYTGRGMPSADCSGYHSTETTLPGPGAMMGMYSNLMRTLARHQTDRVTVTQSGPSVELGRFSMFDAVRFTGGNEGHGMTLVTERGHVRGIDANDAAFSVPSDFTKEDAP